jgi:hypothetical protein
MGISANGAKFLVQARGAGIPFDDVLTLGRQQLIVSPQRLERFMRENALWPPAQGAAEFHRSMAGTNWRFEAFATALGAKKVSSCDASGYEGATVIHDLNTPIAPEWEERFDVIVDGGTLEHVFNFPAAIANCMKMVKTGGHLILFTPANNMCGHGFYQFSPELYYRVLSRENGFEVKRMVMYAEAEYMSSVLGMKYPFMADGPWYHVKDPAEIRKRVPLLNNRATQMCVLAKKNSRETIFKSTPQQSDYVPQWQTGAGSQPAKSVFYGSSNPLVAWLSKTFPESVCRELIPRLAILLDPFRLLKVRRRNSFKNREYYERLPD